MDRRTIRKRLELDGLVQGVGFRPFVAALAKRYDVNGWAANASNGMILELEAVPGNIRRFITGLNEQKPSLAHIESIQITELRPEYSTRFELRKSLMDGPQSVYAAPDIAVCTACLDECFDSSNRRFRYPFISCSHCGPRFSIVMALPYDRARTSMRDFILCKACLREYESFSDRRYHAQTNACWDCGPQLELWNAKGSIIARQDQALVKAVAALNAGQVLALKGIGGYQLLVNANDQQAVLKLRKRKRRPDKPFAVMCADIDGVGRICRYSTEERVALVSPVAPIVLLRHKKPGSALAESVAPGNVGLGVMLANSPLHHIILHDFGGPVVATSANVNGEPICTDEINVLDKLYGIADLFLVHNRTIQRPLDDSLVSIVAGTLLVHRRARGYVPSPIKINQCVSESLAVGGHLKSTVAVAKNQHVVMSQYLGDLVSDASLDGFFKTIKDLQTLFAIRPGIVAKDWHPDYNSNDYLAPSGTISVGIQHHYAHVLACMAEHGVEAPVLGVAWDGFGLGLDNCLWGGEFLRIEQLGFQRWATLRDFHVCGGAKVATEPRRSALAFICEIFGDDALEDSNLAPLRAFKSKQLSILFKAQQRRINTSTTSSVGRLFDAVASLLDLCQISTFEAQAAIYLEHLAYDSDEEGAYPYKYIQSGQQSITYLDWEPMLRMIIKECRSGVKNADISRKFHNTLVEMLINTADRAGVSKVILSGGSFQNRYLLERCIGKLRENGYTPYWPQRIPSNDSGLALGQILGACRDAVVCV